MVEKTEQNTLFKTSPEKRLYKSKKPCESARERSDKYSLHFIWWCENVHWELLHIPHLPQPPSAMKADERARFRLLTYSFTTTTNRKNTCLTLYISASLAPRQTQQFRDQNPPKIFKRQQQNSLQVYPNEIPQTDRRKKHMNLLHLLLLDRIPNQTEQTSRSTLLAE